MGVNKHERLQGFWMKHRVRFAGIVILCPLLYFAYESAIGVPFYFLVCSSLPRPKRRGYCLRGSSFLAVEHNFVGRFSSH